MRRAGRRGGQLQRLRGLKPRYPLPSVCTAAPGRLLIGFEDFPRCTAGALDFDIVLETKAKDLAVLRLRDQLTSRSLSTDDEAIRVDSGWGLRR
jgi:hypothetical protein